MKPLNQYFTLGRYFASNDRGLGGTVTESEAMKRKKVTDRKSLIEELGVVQHPAAITRLNRSSEAPKRKLRTSEVGEIKRKIEDETPPYPF
jgi:hypothetical protein